MSVALHKPEDPREVIRKKLGQRLDEITLFHNQILVVTYVRDQVTRGGIIRPDSVLKEDEYQGKVGLCVLKGPTAFKDEGDVKFHGQDVQVGDWLVYRMSDGWQLTFPQPDGTKLHCRILEDAHIKMKVTAPEMVY